MEQLLQRAEAETGLTLPLEPAAREAMIAMADGDGRYLLTLAETLLSIGSAKPLTAGRAGRGAAEAQPGLRQGSRGALQPHQRPA
jgi:putative ATPase